jgi:hypothetical protein
MSSLNLGNLGFTFTADDTQLDAKYESAYAKARAWQEKMAQLTKVRLTADDDNTPSNRARRPSMRDRVQAVDGRPAGLAASRSRRNTALGSADDDEILRARTWPTSSAN